MQVQPDSDDKPYDDINITPMLDLAYVLLIIFIIMTTSAVQGIKVDLPKASAATSLNVPKTKVIGVANDGTITLDAIPVSMGELQSELREDVAVDPTLPVIIKGDRAVQYQAIMQVLDLCGQLGISAVGLQTQRVSP